MNNYKQEIERINDKMEKLERDGIILDIDLSFNKQQKVEKNKWSYECLKLYKNTLEVINNLDIIAKDTFIQPFHDSRLLNDDNSFNIHNFHEYIKKDKERLFNKLLAHPEKPLQRHSEIREALDNFIDTVEREPQPIIIQYEKMVYEPLELQKELKKIKEDKKTETPLMKISKEYLNLFIDDEYYNKVENFFHQMYSFCTNDKEYKQSIKDEKDKKSLVEKNKLDFLQFLFVFFLFSTSSNYNTVLNFSYPIYKKIGKNDIDAKKAYIKEGYNISDDEKFTETKRSLKFFTENNRSDFLIRTNNFININNRFYNGRISLIKDSFKLEKNKNLKTANAIMDFYHMQEQYMTIDSLFNFSKIDKKNCKDKIKSNMKSIKDKLENKYRNSKYSDIPDLFEEILKNQESFFKIDDSKTTESLDEDYFDFNCNYSTGIIFSKLTTKYNPEGVNEILEDFESILYNTAARVSDPHFPEKQKEDYYKQLTIFFPEVYKFI